MCEQSLPPALDLLLLTSSVVSVMGYYFAILAVPGLGLWFGAEAAVSASLDLSKAPKLVTVKGLIIC